MLPDSEASPRECQRCRNRMRAMPPTRFDPLFKGFHGINPVLGGDERPAPARGMIAAEWTPAVDILEDDDEFTVKAELPGVAAKDIVVTVDKNVLTLKGERRLEREMKKENYHRMERTYGMFSRSFRLPTLIDTANVRAEYNDGLLKVILPKKAGAKTRNIEVKVAA